MPPITGITGGTFLVAVMSNVTTELVPLGAEANSTELVALGAGANSTIYPHGVLETSFNQEGNRWV